jgi:hypothetical protein
MGSGQVACTKWQGKWDQGNARALNVMLDTIAMKAQEAKKVLMEDDKEISAQAIKKLLDWYRLS